MLSRPRLRRCFEPVSHDGRELFLLDETRQHLFQGAIYARLAPLLDGTRSLEDLLRDAAPHPMHEVLLALGQLEGRGCLVDGPLRSAEPESAWFESMGGEAPDERPRVSLQAVGDADAERLRASLAESGVTVRAEAGADIAIVVADDYMRPELAGLN